MTKSQWERKPYKVKRKKSILKNRFFWRALFFLFFLAGIFYIVFFLPFFQIKKIEISGNQKIQTQEIRDFIQTQISKNITFFRSESILIISPKKISENFISSFAQVESIKIKRDFPDTISVSVQEKGAVAVFNNNEKYYSIDKNGTIFEELSQMNSNFILIQDLNLASSTEIKSGNNVLSPELISQVLEIKSRLKNDINLLAVSADVVSEQRLNVKISDGWEIYFNTKGDINWQLTELKIILENKILPENWKNIDYVDLRFDRVFISPEGLLED
jgi:cell division protein FtsQ